MQDKNDTFELFLRRTDQLAKVLRIRVEDLPEILSISRASLFGYRGGKRPITSKAWRKLEAAERRAGISKKPLYSEKAKKLFGSDFTARLDKIDEQTGKLLQMRLQIASAWTIGRAAGLSEEDIIAETLKLYKAKVKEEAED